MGCQLESDREPGEKDQDFEVIKARHKYPEPEI
jgi:hypothetical protein